MARGRTVGRAQGPSSRPLKCEGVTLLPSRVELWFSEPRSAGSFPERKVVRTETSRPGSRRRGCGPREVPVWA